MENKDFSQLEDCDNRLENIIIKVRSVTTILIDLISKDPKKSDEMLEFRKEQELRVVEIKKHSTTLFQKNNQKTYPKNISLKEVIYLKRNYLLK